MAEDRPHLFILVLFLVLPEKKGTIEIEKEDE